MNSTLPLCIRENSTAMWFAQLELFNLLLMYASWMFIMEYIVWHLAPRQFVWSLSTGFIGRAQNRYQYQEELNYTVPGSFTVFCFLICIILCIISNENNDWTIIIKAKATAWTWWGISKPRARPRVFYSICYYNNWKSDFQNKIQTTREWCFRLFPLMFWKPVFEIYLKLVIADTACVHDSTLWLINKWLIRHRQIFFFISIYINSKGSSGHPLETSESMMQRS